jgi:hypothetical protein
MIEQCFFNRRFVNVFPICAMTFALREQRIPTGETIPLHFSPTFAFALRPTVDDSLALQILNFPNQAKHK